MLMVTEIIQLTTGTEKGQETATGHMQMVTGIRLLTTGIEIQGATAMHKHFGTDVMESKMMELITEASDTMTDLVEVCLHQPKSAIRAPTDWRKSLSPSLP